eukprot:6073666-Prymnesium_polylepis.1
MQRATAATRPSRNITRRASRSLIRLRHRCSSHGILRMAVRTLRRQQSSQERGRPRADLSHAHSGLAELPDASARRGKAPSADP